MKLSILIPTLMSRQDYLDLLLACLRPQLTDDVEVIIEADNGELSTGAKRNICVSRATGEYLVHIDDDDIVVADYVQTVLKATEEGKDAIGYWVERYKNGVKTRRAFHSMGVDRNCISKTLSKESIYLRLINHICPVKASLARQVPFKDMTIGEDTDYSYRLKPLLTSETFIDRSMYHYYFRSRVSRKEKTHKD